MPPVITVLVPSLLFSAALVLGRREWTHYRRAGDNEALEIFPYTPMRFARRMAGIAILVAMGGTFAALGLWPPDTAFEAGRYIAALCSELVMLVLLPIWDLWELGRTSRRR